VHVRHVRRPLLAARKTVVVVVVAVVAVTVEYGRAVLESGVGELLFHGEEESRLPERVLLVD